LKGVSSAEQKKRMLGERLKLIKQCRLSLIAEGARISAKHLRLAKAGLYPIGPAETALRDTGLRPEL
jgi:hypothetical protein